MTKEAKVLDPMLMSAIERMQERGPKWYADEAKRWCILFISTVDLIYPAKAARKSRAKLKEE